MKNKSKSKEAVDAPKELAKPSKSFDRPECEICARPYQDNWQRTPKMLSCGHTICAECATGLAGRLGLDIACPFDRKTTELSMANAQGLPNNFAILDMVRAHPDAANDPPASHPEPPPVPINKKISQIMARLVLRGGLNLPDNRAPGLINFIMIASAFLCFSSWFLIIAIGVTRNIQWYFSPESNGTAVANITELVNATGIANLTGIANTGIANITEIINATGIADLPDVIQPIEEM